MAVDWKSYDASKETIKQLKLIPDDTISKGNIISPFSSKRIGYTKEIEKVFKEHLTIIRTSGIRPGRENILVEHAESLHEKYKNTIDSLQEMHKQLEKEWLQDIAYKDRMIEMLNDTYESDMDVHEHQVESWKHATETKHFEELETLTESYDKKIHEIEKKYEKTLKIIHEKAKLWKISYENKIKNEIEKKINQLKIESENELKIVINQMDKNILKNIEKINIINLEKKQILQNLNELNEKYLKKNEIILKYEKNIQNLNNELKNKNELNQILNNSIEIIQNKYKNEINNLLNQELLKQKNKITIEFQNELNTIHERIHQTIEIKNKIIKSLENQLNEAKNQIEISNHLFQKINNDIQFCNNTSIDF